MKDLDNIENINIDDLYNKIVALIENAKINPGVRPIVCIRNFDLILKNN